MCVLFGFFFSLLTLGKHDSLKPLLIQLEHGDIVLERTQHDDSPVISKASSTSPSAAGAAAAVSSSNTGGLLANNIQV